MFGIFAFGRAEDPNWRGTRNCVGLLGATVEGSKPLEEQKKEKIEKMRIEFTKFSLHRQ